MQKIDRALQMVQHVEHHHAGKEPVPEGKPMCVGDDIDTRKRQDIGTYDVRPEFLDVGRAAADVENASVGTALEQLPVKIPIQKANGFFLFPLGAVAQLALVQTVRAP